jgi:hypothetical protein
MRRHDAGWQERMRDRTAFVVEMLAIQHPERP